MATENVTTIKSNKSKLNIKGPTQEQIIAGFNDLRQQQRGLAAKISELEMDCKEHELVIDALKEVKEDRKCFRMIGGVLVERTVKEVLPALINNEQQLRKLIETLTVQLESKGRDVNAYREKHGIRVRGEEESGEKAHPAEEKSKSATQGVLVSGK